MRKLTLSILAIVGLLMVSGQAFGALTHLQPVYPHYVTAPGGTSQAGYMFNPGGTVLYDDAGTTAGVGDTGDSLSGRPTDTDSDVAYHQADNEMWNAGDQTGDWFFVVDFGFSTPVGTIWLWNYLLGGNSDLGMNEVEIYMSDDGGGSSNNTTAVFGANPDWTGTFLEATTSGTVGGKSAIVREDKTGLGLSGQYLKWVVTSNYGDEDAGVAEIAFFTPEPATMAFLGLGTLGTMLLRKKRR